MGIDSYIEFGAAMGSRTKQRIVGLAPFLILLVVLVGFPIYSYCALGSPQPGHKLIENTVTQQCLPEADCHGSSAPTVEVLSHFYDTIITILLAVLAVVAGLAIWSLRLISRSAAEDIAREAVHKVIKDSREFHEKITTAISDGLDDSLQIINQRLDKIEEALKLKSQSAPAAAAEAVPENQIVVPDQEDV